MVQSTQYIAPIMHNHISSRRDSAAHVVPIRNRGKSPAQSFQDHQLTTKTTNVNEFDLERTRNWEVLLQNTSSRCDFSGFLRDDQKFSVDLRQVPRHNTCTEKLVELDSALLQHVHRFHSNYGFCVYIALQFAWHKSLSVYGNGEETVLATFLPRDQFTNERLAYPVHIDHASSGGSVIREHLVSIKEKIDRQCNQKDAVLVDQMNTGLFDGSFTICGIGCSKSVFHLFPLNCVVHVLDDEKISMSVFYAEKLFDSKLIDGLVDIFGNILKQVLVNPSTRTSELQFLSAAQMQELDRVNDTHGPYPRDKRLNELVEEAAARTPDNVAVRYKSRQLSYKELNESANRLAHYLVQGDDIQVSPEQVIALFLDKSEMMIVAVLAIWKSGACYSPIDPSYPDARVQFSLRDTGARIVLANKRYCARIRSLSGDDQVETVIDIEGVFEKAIKFPSNNPCLGLVSSQLAYVTYTSGTTGVPKGIQKRHTNVVNSITDLAERYGVAGGHEVIVLFSPYVFEPFARQTLMALINSQVLVVVDDDTKLDPVLFPKIIKDYGITYLNGTASVLQEYDYSDCPSLKKLVLVGEDLTEVRYNALRRKFPQTIINEYGFTESAFVTAMKLFEPHDQRKDRSLGRPLRNVKCYILNQYLQRLPVAVVGELWIGGQGVSNGYLNRPELTNERFLANPFQTLDEKRRGENSIIYKTGDLARWIPGVAEVEYLGRNDFQLKLRGIRIEPGEIESVLASYPGVERAVVVAKVATQNNVHPELGNKHLVGYFTGNDLGEEVLLQFLESQLPRYMVPARLLHMERIPTTINGKVDFPALPEVTFVKENANMVAPRTECEKKLAAIWGEVLHVDATTLSVNDNFFYKGGQSITCIQLVGRIWQAFNVRLTHEEIFSLRTIEKLADLVTARNQAGQNLTNGTLLSKKQVIIPEHLQTSDVDAVYLANSLQQGLMYHYLKQGANDTAAYIMQGIYNYHQQVKSSLYRTAWEVAQARYASLRLRFVSEQAVYQVVDTRQDLDWTCIEFDRNETSSLEYFLSKLKAEDERREYKLERGKLFRVYLVSTYNNESAVLFSAHHSIMDGWSLPILFSFVHDTYLKLQAGYQTLTDPDTAFHDCQAYLQGNRAQNIDFWKRRMDQIEERCDLKGLVRDEYRYKVNLTTYDHIKTQKEQTVYLGQWAGSSLKTSCSREAITLHSVLQFIWHKVLNVYGNGQHTVTGTIVSGRDLPVDDIDSAVGLLINTLPLLVDHKAQAQLTIINAMKIIQEDVLAMSSRSNVELGRLSDSALAHQLFDSLFVLENYPKLDEQTAERQSQKLRFSSRGSSEKLNFVLAVVCQESEVDGITFTLRYASELLEDDTIKSLLDVVSLVYQQIFKDVRQKVANLEFLGGRQLASITRYNDIEQEYPQWTLSDLFVQEAQAVPNKIALIYESTKVSYRDMDRMTNQLARYFRSIFQHNQDAIVALVMDKSELMFIAIFAAWKAGFAFVPIDPSFPEDRISYILDETRAAAVLASTRHVKKIPKVTTKNFVIVSIEDSVRKARSFDTGTLASFATNRDLAYIYFTSGTSGNPKGVMIEHRGVVNLQRSLRKTFHLKETDDEVIFSFSNYSFDHFIEMMTDALLNGQTLLILNDEMRADKPRLYRYMIENRVTYLSGTPSVISMYEYAGMDFLRRVDCVGEDFSAAVFERIRKDFHHSDALIINGYGPTEVSITSHKRLYWPGEKRTNKSIGHQVANIRTYVLNEHMKRIPIGAVGELYLGGDGVGRGYLNRPELTAQSFPANLHQTEKDKAQGRDARLYKTGDLVRWLPNFEIEYLGRADSQIKLRGQRVELGEIEAAITSCPGIKQSVVIAKTVTIESNPMAQKYLVGYYVCSRAQAENQLKRELRRRLPDNLIPNRLLEVDTLPVTVSGKLDVKHLPEVEFATSSNYVAPRNELELELCKIWADLLGVLNSHVSITDDFFSLGGDSLMSTRLSFVTTQRFKRNINVASIFRNRTIENLAAYIQNEAGEDDAIKPAEISSFYKPLSLSQERIAFIDDFEGGSDAYNIIKLFDVPPCVCTERLKRSLYAVVMRHAPLRTMLVRRQGSSHREQKVLDDEDFVHSLFTVQDIETKNEDDLNSGINEASKQIFDLSSDIPIRASMYLRADVGCILCLVVHHTAMDGYGFGMFMRDLAVFYESDTISDATSRLPALPIQYSDYCVWQRLHMQEQHMRAMTEFWQEQLSDVTPVNLPTDFRRPRHFEYQGNNSQLEISREAYGAVCLLARNLGLSTMSIMVGVYILMLKAYSDQDDITIGIPMINRGRPELQDLVGLFINMVVLRVKIPSGLCLEDFLNDVHEQLIHAQMNQEMPFENVIKLLGVENDPGKHPIFQHVFSTDMFDFNEGKTTNDTSNFPLTPYMPTAATYSTAKFDLSLSITEAKGNIIVNFSYPISLFEDRTVDSFKNTFDLLLRQIISTDKTPITQIDKMLLVPEVEQVNGNSSSYSQLLGSDLFGPLHKNFESQVSRHPDKMAVVSIQASLTYQQLELKANQLAHFLKCRGVKRGDFVALLMRRSVEVIVSILAVWKVGAAYVPLDPGYPTSRLAFVLEDTAATAVITFKTHWQQLQHMADKTSVMLIDDPTFVKELSTHPTSLVDLSCTKEDKAYCIYTSGTTGKPKGVVVRHENVLNLLIDLRARYFSGSVQNEVVLQLSSVVFDFSIEQFVLSFLSSHKLIIPPPTLELDANFYDFINAQGVTYVSGTPSLLCQMDMSKIKSLRMVTSAGEQLHAHQYAKIRSEFSGPINNAYGITETTVYNTVKRFEATDIFENTLGDSIGGQRLYVAAKSLQLVPSGAVGELYIAGDCVATGYLNQPVLTKTKFLPNPWRSVQEVESNQYLTVYKSGDLVRLSATGTLRYLGRMDTQIKLRGFRIEVEEINEVLRVHEGVKDSVVVPRLKKGFSGQAESIVAFFVTDRLDVSVESIVNHLRDCLPVHCIPSEFVPISGALPATINGKIDTEKLLELSSNHVPTTVVQPRNYLEARHLALWKEILGHDCGIEDDFFHVGGDSISSLGLSSRIEQELGRRVTAQDIFLHRTIARITDAVLSKQNPDNATQRIVAELGTLSGPLDMIPIQKWFFSKRLASVSHWNQCFCICTPPLDIDQLNLATRALCLHHDVLRIQFTKEHGEWVQCYSSSMPPPVATINMAELSEPLPDKLTKLHSSLDITRGPIMRTVYIHGFDDGTAKVVFIVHHLVVDVVSWQIITRDLQGLYEGKSLGVKSSSYRQWATSLAAYKIDGAEKAMWSALSRRCNAARRLAWKQDVRSVISLKIEKDQTQALVDTLNRVLDANMQDCLLSALGQAAYNLTGEKSLPVTIEGHGREPLDRSVDVTNTVGWFTTMYPFVIESEDAGQNSIIRIRDDLRAIPSKGVGWGILYGYVDSHLPDVSFNFLGTLTKKSNERATWRAEHAMSNEYGHCQSPCDQAANQSALDITAWIADGSLTVELSSHLDSSETQQLAQELEKALQNTTLLLTGRATCQPAPSKLMSAGSFTPYFKFDKPPRQGSNLFLLPPGEGGAESYFNNIVVGMSKTPLVVFNNYHLHSPDTQATFESLASRYIAWIRAVQPNGPYHIAGWSFGGVLALEICRQLTATGEQIGTYASIDSYFNVRHACAAIGEQENRDILDPINYIYQPDTVSLKKMMAATKNVVLFKSPRMNERARNESQTKLFEYYRSSEMNGLGTLVSKEQVRVVEMRGETHFTWVRNPDVVGEMCDILAGYVAT